MLMARETKIPAGSLCECTDSRCLGCDTGRKGCCDKPASELVYDGPGDHADSALCKACASWVERAS